MIVDNRKCRVPIATFVIERVVGVGYQVTSSDGESAASLEKAAIDVLDGLDQSEAATSGERLHWIGPVGNPQSWVVVRIQTLETGELRYEETWFRTDSTEHRWQRRLATFVSALVIGIAVGIFGLLTYHKNYGQRASPLHSLEKIPAPMVSISPEERAVLNAFAQLQMQLSRDSDVREKLRAFLDQRGLAPDPTLPVKQEKKSVMLVAMLDQTPPPIETSQFTNLEVEKILELLATLSETESLNESSSLVSEIKK